MHTSPGRGRLTAAGCGEVVAQSQMSPPRPWAPSGRLYLAVAVRPPHSARSGLPGRSPPPDRPSHATASRRPRLGRRHVGLAQGDGQLQVLLLLPPQPRQPLLLRLLALPLGPCQLLFLIAKLQRGKTERGLRGPRCGGGDLGLCGMRWGEDCIARQGSGDGRDAAAVSVYGKGVGG